MRDYGKVFSRIWESADFRSLSEDGRTLVMYLLTCQHGTIAGVFRVPDGYACEDLQWAVERVSAAFAELLRKGFANRCETTKWVWVAKFLEWNPPENPNQRKAGAKIARSVPDDCAWKLDFMRVCGPSLGIEPMPEVNPSQTLREGLPNQEQKQYQEQKQEQKNSAPDGAGADAPSPAPLPSAQAAAPEPAPQPEQPTAQDQVYAIGVTLLTAADVSDRNARSFLAAQVKAFGAPRVLQALQACAAERPIQPVPWIVTALGGKPGKAPNRQEALEQRNRQVARSWAAKGAGHAAG
jgi:hypothetical protein